MSGMKRAVVLLATDTPQNVEPQCLLSWLASGAGSLPPIAITTDTLSVSVDGGVNTLLLDAIRQSVESAVPLRDDDTANILVLAFCPSATVAYHLLDENSPYVAGLIVVNSLHEPLPAPPPSASVAAAAKPAAKKGVGVSDAKKEKPPSKATGRGATADTTLVDDESNRRSGPFDVELAHLCGEIDSSVACDAVVVGQPDSATSPTAGAPLSKRALFAAMELVVVPVSSPPQTWSERLNESIFPALRRMHERLDAAVAADASRAARFVLVPTLSRPFARTPQQRGPSGMFHKQSADDLLSSTGGPLLRAATGKRISNASRGSSPHKENASHALLTPRATLLRSGESLTAASTLLAPGGSAAACAARVTSLLVAQTEKNAMAAGAIRTVLRVERRHIPSTAVDTPEAQPSAEEGSSPEVVSDASHSVVPSLAPFVPVDVAVGQPFEIPVAPFTSAPSTFEDVWAAVRSVCAWAGPMSASITSETSVGVTVAPPIAAPPERPTTTRRATAFVDADQKTQDNALGDQLPRPGTVPGSRGSNRAPSPGHTDIPAITERRVSNTAERERSRSVISLASLFGRDAAESRLLAQQAAKKWEDAIALERNTVASDPRRERAADRLLRLAKARVEPVSRGKTALHGDASSSSHRLSHEDTMQLRQLAHDTVTNAEAVFALLQARAQVVVDRLVAFDAAEGNETLIHDGHPMSTEADDRAPHLPQPCTAALAAAAVDLERYVFVQSVQVSDALRILSDLEAPPHGEFRTEWAVLDPDLSSRSVEAALHIAAGSTSPQSLQSRDEPWSNFGATTPSMPPVRIDTSESRPSSSGSVLRSVEGSMPTRPAAVGLVCAARVVPLSGVHAFNTTFLLGSALGLIAQRLMDESKLHTHRSPFTAFCQEWASPHRRRLVGPRLSPAVPVTEESVAWYLADGSILVAQSISTSTERRISLSVVDITASMTAVPSPEHGSVACGFVATFPDETVLRVAGGGVAAESSPETHLTTRGGHVCSFTPFRSAAAVRITRAPREGLPLVVAVFDPDHHTLCRRQVNELSREIDRSGSGRVTCFMTDHVRVILDAATGTVCSMVHTAAKVGMLIIYANGTREGRVIDAAPASHVAVHQLPPLEVLHTSDVQTRASLWSRSDGTLFVAFPDGASIATFADGTRVYMRRAALSTAPFIQVESPCGAEAPPVPTILLGSDGLLSLYCADSADGLAEQINAYGQREVSLERRSGTSVTLDVATRVIRVTPWTLPTVLGAPPGAGRSAVPRKELLAALVGVHVFDTLSGGYRCVDIDLKEYSVGLNVSAGASPVKPLETLHTGITPGPDHWIDYWATVAVDMEALLLRIGGLEKIVPPRSVQPSKPSSSSAPAADPQQKDNTGAVPTTNTAASACDERIRSICMPMVTHYDLLSYASAKQREAYRRREGKVLQEYGGVATWTSMTATRPVVLAFMDDGSVSRLLTAADIAPLVRHAMGTSTVTLSTGVVGGEPGIQQVSYVLDASRKLPIPLADDAMGRSFVQTTKQTVLQARDLADDAAPPPPKTARLPSFGTVLDLDALMPRGLQPPAHVLNQLTASVADANPPLAINFAQYEPIAKLLRHTLVADAVAQLDAAHAAELYMATLLVPDCPPARHRDGNARVAMKHAYTVTQYVAKKQAENATTTSVAKNTCEASEKTDALRAASSRFDSTTKAAFPIRVSPDALRFAKLPRGFKYQSFITVENTTDGPLTVSVSKSGAMPCPCVAIQSGRRALVPAMRSVSIGVIINAGESDPSLIETKLAIEASGAPGPAYVPVSAALVPLRSALRPGEDVARVGELLPTSVRVIGVAATAPVDF